MTEEVRKFIIANTTAPTKLLDGLAEQYFPVVENMKEICETEERFRSQRNYELLTCFDKKGKRIWFTSRAGNHPDKGNRTFFAMSKEKVSASDDIVSGSYGSVNYTPEETAEVMGQNPVVSLHCHPIFWQTSADEEALLGVNFSNGDYGYNLHYGFKEMRVVSGNNIFVMQFNPEITEKSTEERDIHFKELNTYLVARYSHYLQAYSAKVNQFKDPLFTIEIARLIAQDNASRDCAIKFKHHYMRVTFPDPACKFTEQTESYENENRARTKVSKKNKRFFTVIDSIQSKLNIVNNQLETNLNVFTEARKYHIDGKYYQADLLKIEYYNSLLKIAKSLEKLKLFDKDLRINFYYPDPKQEMTSADKKNEYDKYSDFVDGVLQAKYFVRYMQANRAKIVSMALNLDKLSKDNEKISLLQYRYDQQTKKMISHFNKENNASRPIKLQEIDAVGEFYQHILDSSMINDNDKVLIINEGGEKSKTSNDIVTPFLYAARLLGSQYENVAVHHLGIGDVRYNAWYKGEYEHNGFSCDVYPSIVEVAAKNPSNDVAVQRLVDDATKAKAAPATSKNLNDDFAPANPTVVPEQDYKPLLGNYNRVVIFWSDDQNIEQIVAYLQYFNSIVPAKSVITVVLDSDKFENSQLYSEGQNLTYFLNDNRAFLSESVHDLIATQGRKMLIGTITTISQDYSAIDFINPSVDDVIENVFTGEKYLVQSVDTNPSGEVVRYNMFNYNLQKNESLKTAVAGTKTPLSGIMGKGWFRMLDKQAQAMVKNLWNQYVKKIPDQKTKKPMTKMELLQNLVYPNQQLDVLKRLDGEVVHHQYTVRSMFTKYPEDTIANIPVNNPKAKNGKLIDYKSIPTVNGLTLLTPLQYDGINKAVYQLKNYGRFFNADTTGFGKTRQILMIAYIMSQLYKKPSLIFTESEKIIDQAFMGDAKSLGLKVKRYEGKIENSNEPTVYIGFFKNQISTYSAKYLNRDLMTGADIAKDQLNIPKELTWIKSINRFQDYWEAGAKEVVRFKEDPTNFAVVIFDEAHYLRNATSETPTRWRPQNHVNAINNAVSKVIEDYKKKHQNQLPDDEEIAKIKSAARRAVDKVFPTYYEGANQSRIGFMLSKEAPRVAFFTATALDRITQSFYLHDCGFVPPYTTHQEFDYLGHKGGLSFEGTESGYSSQNTEENAKKTKASTANAKLKENKYIDERIFSANLGDKHKYRVKDIMNEELDDEEKEELYYMQSNIFDIMAENGFSLRRDVSYDNLIVHSDTISLDYQLRKEYRMIESYYMERAIREGKKYNSYTMLINSAKEYALESYKARKMILRAEQELGEYDGAIEQRSIVLFTNFRNESGGTPKSKNDKKTDEAEIAEYAPYIRKSAIQIFMDYFLRKYPIDEYKNIYPEGIIREMKAEPKSKKKTGDDDDDSSPELNDKQQQLISDFLHNKFRIFVSTVDMGGTGISLDDRKLDGVKKYYPRTMMLPSTPSNVLQYVQAIGRISRMTTQSKSKVILFFTPAPIDVLRKMQLKAKLEMLKAVIGEDIGKLGAKADEFTDWGFQAAKLKNPHRLATRINIKGEDEGSTFDILRTMPTDGDTELIIIHKNGKINVSENSSALPDEVLDFVAANNYLQKKLKIRKGLIPRTEEIEGFCIDFNIDEWEKILKFFDSETIDLSLRYPVYKTGTYVQLKNQLEIPKLKAADHNRSHILELMDNTPTFTISPNRFNNGLKPGDWVRNTAIGYVLGYRFLKDSDLGGYYLYDVAWFDGVRLQGVVFRMRGNQLSLKWDQNVEIEEDILDEIKPIYEQKKEIYKLAENEKFTIDYSVLPMPKVAKANKLSFEEKSYIYNPVTELVNEYDGFIADIKKDNKAYSIKTMLDKIASFRKTAMLKHIVVAYINPYKTVFRWIDCNDDKFLRIDPKDKSEKRTPIDIIKYFDLKSAEEDVPVQTRYWSEPPNVRTKRLNRPGYITRVYYIEIPFEAPAVKDETEEAIKEYTDYITDYVSNNRMVSLEFPPDPMTSDYCSKMVDYCDSISYNIKDVLYKISGMTLRSLGSFTKEYIEDFSEQLSEKTKSELQYLQLGIANSSLSYAEYNYIGSDYTKALIAHRKAENSTSGNLLNLLKQINANKFTKYLVDFYWQTYLLQNKYKELKGKLAKKEYAMPDCDVHIVEDVTPSGKTVKEIAIDLKGNIPNDDQESELNKYNFYYRPVTIKDALMKCYVSDYSDSKYKWAVERFCYKEN